MSALCPGKSQDASLSEEDKEQIQAFLSLVRARQPHSPAVFRRIQMAWSNCQDTLWTAVETTVYKVTTSRFSSVENSNVCPQGEVAIVDQYPYSAKKYLGQYPELPIGAETSPCFIATFPCEFKMDDLPRQARDRNEAHC